MTPELEHSEREAIGDTTLHQAMEERFSNLNTQPVDAREMREMKLEKSTEILVCECGCKKFRILFQGGRTFFACLHCKKPESTIR